MNGFVLVTAALLALWFLSSFYEQPTCVQCRGRGRHRKGCKQGGDK